MLLTTGAVLGAAATMGERPWLRLPMFGTNAVALDVNRSPLARLILRNGGVDAVRGRVFGPGSVSRAFLVPAQEVHDLWLQGGEITVEFDTPQGLLRRSLRLRSGETATLDYPGS
jgi:hypothetical protein